MPDYEGMDPLVLHVAFVSEDAAADAARLGEAGARQVAELNFPDGSIVLMLRDPWGLALQLCQRATPLMG